jgi:hypothetical protein
MAINSSLAHSSITYRKGRRLRKEKPMSGIRTVVVDPEAPIRLVLADVEEPSPTPSEVLVHVATVSVNRGR